jgi:hypothetical protein
MHGIPHLGTGHWKKLGGYRMRLMELKPTVIPRLFTAARCLMDGILTLERRMLVRYRYVPERSKCMDWTLKIDIKGMMARSKRHAYIDFLDASTSDNIHLTSPRFWVRMESSDTHADSITGQHHWSLTV